jgi:hypothetical protein
MKPNIISRSGWFLSACLLVAGCTKDFKETNTDPTLITKDKIRPALLLSSVQKQAVFNVFNNHSTVMEYAGYYKNPASGNIFQVRNFADPYNVFYRTYLINTSEIIRLTATDPNLSNQHHMARIWRAWLFHQLTDAYGDIPYTDALKDVSEMVLQPKYDTQESIYKDLLKELKEAEAALATTADKISYGNADLLMKGNVELWQRFANSLRLRLAIRIRFVEPELARQIVQELQNSPVLETNSQNVKLATVNDGNTANVNQFFTKNQTSPNNMVVSFTLTENLKKYEDPRISVFATPSPIPEAGYRGVPMQLAGTEGNRYSSDSTARMAASFLQPIMTLFVMTAAEVYFLKAEAALAGLTSDDAQELYALGIRASMEQYGVAAADITSFLAGNGGTLMGTDEEKLEQIIVQKWIAIYYNSNEGWAEFRRTGYPRIWTGGNLGDTEGQIPRRLTYPYDEFFRNQANVTEAANRLPGGDLLTSKIWWDKKAGVPVAHPRQGMYPPEIE